MWIRGAVTAVFLPVTVCAEQPLSAIAWLDRHGPVVLTAPAPIEPPVTRTALRPQIQTSALDSRAPLLGLVPASVTGLPPDLWRASDAGVLADLIADAPVRNSPALQTLLYTLLLSETYAPDDRDAAETLLLARLDRLIDLGAVEPAQELAQIADPTRSAARFLRWFEATLLTGDEDRGCAALLGMPHLAPGYDARIFCAARSGDWETAALLLEAAHALDLIAPDQLELLDRFLSPDVFEGAPPLEQPDHPDPLTFRLFETIGEPLPTGALPRAFATADLRDLAGWKAQVEAAERLARVGALSPNRLLGLYTERRAAASGGVWDRIKAVQRLDTALVAGSADAVGKTLPAAWAQMRAAGLEVPFAELFGPQLGEIAHDNTAIRTLSWRIRLLGSDYRSVALSPPDTGRDEAFLAALALGDPGRVPAPNDLAVAIRDGWSDQTQLPGDLARARERGELGVAILRAIGLFQTGASGNPVALAQALAFLRAVGLEDTARRAALQLILLERQ